MSFFFRKIIRINAVILSPYLIDRLGISLTNGNLGEIFFFNEIVVTPATKEIMILLF